MKSFVDKLVSRTIRRSVSLRRNLRGLFSGKNISAPPKCLKCTKMPKVPKILTQNTVHGHSLVANSDHKKDK
jgi:hypothetical protein